MMRARWTMGAVGALVLGAWACSSSSTPATSSSSGSSGNTSSGGSGTSGTSGSSGTSGTSGSSGSSGTSGTSGSSGSSGSVDAGPDAPRGDGDLCSNAACTGGDVCCAVPAAAGGLVGKCMASCPNGAPPVTCDGNEECQNGQVCCGTVTTGAGSFPNCPAVSASSSCVTTCKNSIAFTCPGTSTSQRCHASADCVDAQNPLCCTFQQSGQSLSFCTSQLIATGGGATCN